MRTRRIFLKDVFELTGEALRLSKSTEEVIQGLMKEAANATKAHHLDATAADHKRGSDGGA